MNNSTALDRFTGADGLRHLTEAFAKQAIVNGDEQLAAAMAGAAIVEPHPAGAAIITQGNADTDFYLILCGAVDVERNGRADRIRVAGEHFGEMTLIDVHAKRSATVRAREETIVARIPEAAFTAIAADHAKLWRCLAVEIADRLRQRLADAPPKNDKPHVFIGSSHEARAIAEAIQAGISDDTMVVKLWTDDLFEVSATNIESLEAVVRDFDIAILVLAPDDTLRSRGQTERAPRDNVIFELGLFMGALRRKRVFMVRPSQWPTRPPGVLGLLADWGARTLRIPTDLLGVAPLTYDAGGTGNLADRLAPACTALKAAIRKQGAK